MEHAQSSPAQWARIEALFPELLALPESRRAAFLAKLDPEPWLRAELESLLSAAQGESCLDHAPAIEPTPPAHVLAPLRTGQRLGAWQIVRPLGHGGMGEVYLAERAEGGFAQACAVKCLRGDAVEHAARFESERAILAQLDHPNIARLLDGGISADGRAWMAMEYVVGENLDHYCAAHGLGLAARIALFDQVCGAVAYAHAHLVVHRDLKPANILVTAEGQAKLLDFGIAKLLDLNQDATRTQSALLTPAHAAPEQFEGGELTTAVDVYALGVLLYQLLSGKLPWPAGHTPVSVVVDRLLTDEPPPPSRAGAETPPCAPSLLRGDLDAIVRRCLRKSPRDRYPTVEALREDLSRWRRRQPVEARRGAKGYALRRWLWRHRLGAAAAGLVLLALLAGLATTLWQARRAQQQAERAERVKNLVLNVFRESDPLSRPGSGQRSPAQLVGDGVAAADRDLANEPELHAQMLDDLGEIQINLGDVAGGRATLERALALRRALHPGDDARTAQTLRKVAVAYLTMQEQPLGLATANEAYGMLARLGLAGSPEAARARLLQAAVLMSRKQRDQALQLTIEAQGIFERELGRNDPETAAAVFRRAQVLEQLRRDDESIAMGRDAVARLEISFGPDSPRLITPLGALADALEVAHPEESVAAYERAVALARRHFGTRHHLLGTMLNREANLVRTMGDYPRAEKLFARAQSALPAGDHERAQLFANRGKLWLAMARFTQAEADLRAAFTERRVAMGDKAGIVWYDEVLWGAALRALGRLEQAEQVQREALAHLQRIIGPDGYQNVLLMDELVETLSARGKHEEAVELARRSLALTGKTYPPTHPLVADRTMRLAKALGASDLAAWRKEAVQVCDGASRMLADSSADRPEYPAGLVDCAKLHLNVADKAGAREHLQVALQVLRAHSKDDPHIAEVRELLAKAGEPM
ncbi:MAG TPA: serine/threonine-protein kinase [Rhodanobacteraceae bacterium]